MFDYLFLDVCGYEKYLGKDEYNSSIYADSVIVACKITTKSKLIVDKTASKLENNICFLLNNIDINIGDRLAGKVVTSVVHQRGIDGEYLYTSAFIG